MYARQSRLYILRLTFLLLWACKTDLSLLNVHGQCRGKQDISPLDAVPVTLPHATCASDRGIDLANPGASPVGPQSRQMSSAGNARIEHWLCVEAMCIVGLGANALQTFDCCCCCNCNCRCNVRMHVRLLLRLFPCPNVWPCVCLPKHFLAQGPHGH